MLEAIFFGEHNPSMAVVVFVIAIIDNVSEKIVWEM